MLTAMERPLSLVTLLDRLNMSAAGLSARVTDATGQAVTPRMAQRWAAGTTRMDAADVDAVVRTLGLDADDARRLLAWAASQPAERPAAGEGA